MAFQPQSPAEEVQLCLDLTALTLSTQSVFSWVPDSPVLQVSCLVTTRALQVLLLYVPSSPVLQVFLCFRTFIAALRLFTLYFYTWIGTMIREQTQEHTKSFIQQKCRNKNNAVSSLSVQSSCQHFSGLTNRWLNFPGLLIGCSE